MYVLTAHYKYLCSHNHTLCAEIGVGPDAITWEGGGVCFDPDAGLWPSGRLLSAPMRRQNFP